MAARVFEYRTVQVAPNSWPVAIASIKAKGVKAVEASGGRLFGLWVSQIGLSVNQGVVITEWPDTQSADEEGALALKGTAEVVGSVGELIDPTSRPRDNVSPEPGGIFSHRWFEVREQDWPLFLELSEGCWEEWESVFKADLIGFWRSRAAMPHGISRVRLLARYRDLASWQESRYWTERPDHAAQRALERLRQRREITLDTGVSMMRLALAPTSSDHPVMVPRTEA